MLIYEFEAKKMLEQYNINAPRQFGVYKSSNYGGGISFPAIAKVQILQGKRQKRGGVELVKSAQALDVFLQRKLAIKYDGEAPGGVLVEEAVKDGRDIYVSIIYESYGPALVYNEQGGIDIESAKEELVRIPIDVDNQAVRGELPDLLPPDFITKLLKCFFAEDCRQIEINPLRIFPDGDYCVLDAKVILDERALFRHLGRDFIAKEAKQTERERAVFAINKNPSYTGSPCRYVELEGDIATLLSGGGASLVIFDALIGAGLKPGNYSEYSGNPNKEKVAELMAVVVSKPKQKGLFIAGAVANFTMIDETMAGVAKVLSEVKPQYPIVIRRGGPGEQKAKEMMQALAEKEGLDITWFGSETSILKACAYFIDKVKNNK